MITPKMSNEVFQRNLRVIREQVDGLSDTDALLQLPFRGNCLNWVLGHILDSRQAVFRYLGLPEQTGKKYDELYGGGSEPITGNEPNLPTMSEIMALLNESEKLISDHLDGLSESDLEKEVGEGDRKAQLGKKLEFFGWHEGYHVGQTEYLRQLAGKDDHII